MNHKIRVAILDNDPLSARLLRETLERAGMQVQDLVDLVSPGEADVVVADVKHGPGVAADILAYARVKCRNLPVVAFTAMAMKGDRQRLLGMGYDHYLSKPVGIQRIADLVRSCVGQQALSA